MTTSATRQMHDAHVRAIIPRSNERYCTVTASEDEDRPPKNETTMKCVMRHHRAGEHTPAATSQI